MCQSVLLGHVFGSFGKLQICQNIFSRILTKAVLLKLSTASIKLLLRGKLNHSFFNTTNRVLVEHRMLMFGVSSVKNGCGRQ